jgi:transposase-like protein
VTEYPNDQLAFEDAFHTEAQCLDYFKRIRWKDGFCCRKCGGTNCWEQSRNRYTCKSCRFESTLYSGTLFEGSRLKLRLWYRAIWWVLNQKNGASALGLQKGLGIKSYETAWLMLHKIRQAMVDPKRKNLIGNIEIDEAWVGGKRVGAERKGKGNPIVLVAVEYSEKKLGRIRMSHVPINDSKEIVTFAAQNIESGSHLYSDEWAAYLKLRSIGYRLTQTRSTGVDREVAKVLPRVHLVISLLKNWLNGTHHGRVSQKHLQAYLDEFTFRFNRRTSNSRGLLFKRLLENAIHQPGPTYNELVKKNKRS